MTPEESAVINTAIAAIEAWDEIDPFNTADVVEHQTRKWKSARDELRKAVHALKRWRTI